MAALTKDLAMTTPQDIAANGERASIGRWFDSVSDLVENFPTRIGTHNTKIIFYNASLFGEISNAFNAAANNVDKLQPAAERAVAARHVYCLKPDATQEAADSTAAGRHAKDMLEKMNRLKQLCAKHHIGVTVHATKDGDLQITLIEQVKPKRQFNIKSPKIKFGRGF